MQFAKGLVGQSEEQRYAKEFNEEITKVIARSMEYCVDDLDVFAESKRHPIFLIQPERSQNILAEAGPVAKGAAAAGLTGAAASSLFGYATGTSMATGLTTAAVKFVGATGAAALGIKAAAVILGVLAAGTAVYFVIDKVKKIWEMFGDKIKSSVKFNPWEDSGFVKMLDPIIKKATQGLVAYKYMEIIFALKDKLEKIGVKVKGFDNSAFKEFNSKLNDRKQISRIKNSLTKEGKELQNQFIDNMYRAKNALPREGLGKYLNQSTIDRFLDEIMFGTNSPLAEIFKHGAMSDYKSNESFVYQKGLENLIMMRLFLN